MNKWFAAALLSSLTVFLSDGASARSHCASSDSPMVSSESFGVAGCKRHAPRYHSQDFRGEGARGYAARASEDPMVWSDARWRSTLFGGYARNSDDRYDRRFRRAGGDVHVIRRVERIVIREAPRTSSDVTVQPKGAKLAFGERNAETDRFERGSRFVGNQCRGILVLRWTAGVPRSKCHEASGRIRRIP